MFYNETPNTKIFKEIRKTKVFQSKDGYMIEITDTSDTSFRTASLFSPEGQPINKDQEYWISLYSDNGKGWLPRLITYEELTGLNRDQSVRWAPEHFPQGTRVAVKLPRINERDIIEEFTVSRIICNDIDSYCIVSNEIAADGKPKTFNITHVIGIIGRGTGPLLIENESQGWNPVIKINKVNNLQTLLSRDWFNSQEPCFKGYINIKAFARLIVNNTVGIDFAHRFIDNYKLNKRLIAMGLLKTVNGHDLVKYKPALKFFIKNPHLAFENKKKTHIRNHAYDYRIDDEFVE